MDEKLKATKVNRKHSKLGVVSVLIGAFIIALLIYYIHLSAMWLMTNQGVLKNPGSINGMPVPRVVMNMIVFLLIMEIVGFFCGIFGLLEKHKKRLLPTIGISLNGLFLLITIWKIT